jgi:dienelactone hydrolase
MKRRALLAAAIAVVLELAYAPATRAADWIELPPQAGLPKVYVSEVKTTTPGRVPVALMLHGRTGLDRYNLFSIDMWAKWLNERGVSAVIIDSNRGRGLRGVDDTGNKWLTVVKGRTGDVQRTLGWLPTRGWADPARAFIFGLSNGGTVGIFVAIEGNVTIPQVQLYPACHIRMLDKVHPTVGYPPSLWLSGEYDTVSILADTRMCRDKIAAAGNPDAIKLVVLPHTQHAFDMSPRDVTYSPGAIEQSKVEIDAFLKARALIR